MKYKPMKYKLLKDLPGLKAGAIFEYDEDLERYINSYKGNIYTYKESDIIDSPDWFEKVQKGRWKPEEYEDYFYIDDWYDVEERTYNDDYRKHSLGYKHRNCFKTWEEAQQELDRLNLIAEYRDFLEEKNEGWIPDWSDINDDKICIYLDGQKYLKTGAEGYNKFQPNWMYAKSESIQEQAIEKFGNRLKLLFI